MAKQVHWGWLLLAYLVGSLFPVTKFVPGFTAKV